MRDERRLPKDHLRSWPLDAGGIEEDGEVRAGTILQHCQLAMLGRSLAVQGQLEGQPHIYQEWKRWFVSDIQQLNRNP